MDQGLLVVPRPFEAMMEHIEWGSAAQCVSTTA